MKMKSFKKQWVLFALILVLVFSTALVGWLSNTLYSDNPTNLLIKLRYYDLSLLIIFFPAGVVGLILSILKNQRARLFSLGLTVYLLFSYCVTIFTCQQNNFFLIYVAILALCAFYFLEVFSDIFISFSGTINHRIKVFVSISLLFSAISGIGFLLADAINLLSNHSSEIQVKAPQVFDLAFILPFTIYGVVRLLRKKDNGIWLTSIMMIFFVFIGISVIIMEFGLSIKSGAKLDAGKVYSFSFISLLNLIVAFFTYSNLSIKPIRDQ